MIMKEVVAIYCRVSTQVQKTDRQREELTALANDKGWSVPEDRIYIDKISGFKDIDERVQFNRMLNDIQSKGITTILFSEFTRLARNANELLKQIEMLTKKGIRLYFQKQDLWVSNDKRDLGSTILLHVLAVMASYEIELFAERSVSGKISKIQAGGGGGLEQTLGYKHNENKCIVIDEETAPIVRRIFQEYASGKSTNDICNSLNAEGYRTNKNTEWIPSTLIRMFHNELYIGRKQVVIHKPDPTNPTAIHKRTEREIMYEYDQVDEGLRIVDQETWQAVHDRIEKAKYGKNDQIRHENFIKSKLKCGECGGNFGVNSKTENGVIRRTYNCWNTLKKGRIKQECGEGGQILQDRIDGMVVQFSLQMFAETNLQQTNEKMIEEKEKRVNDLTFVLNSKENELTKLKDDSLKKIRKFASIDDDELSQQLMKEEKEKYQTESTILKAEIDKAKEIIAKLKNEIKSLKKLNITNTLNKQMDEIRNNRTLLKSMVDEYIDTITVYRMHKLWLLIVIKYKNGVEMWGKIKAARYKNNELFFDTLLSMYGTEFQTWILNNTDHSFTYNKNKKTISYNGNSELYQGLEQGEYSYDELNKWMLDNDWMGSFPSYQYEKR